MPRLGRGKTGVRHWLLLSLLVFSVVGPSEGLTRTILAATPIDRLDLPWWRARHEAKLKELAETKPELIFLGDSITQDWEEAGPPEWRDFVPVWQRFYGDRHALNLGFKGDTTASLLWRIRNGEVAGIAPKVAIILIGANNLGRVHWSAEDTVAGIDMIIHELHRRLPATKILLLSVLPSERSVWISDTTAQINRMLATRYKDGRSVSFLDLTAVFMRNGKLDRDLFFDPRLTPPDPPVHPSAEGQALMAKAMEPVLADMLGDKPHGDKPHGDKPH
jgi:lysophospholipase L1-like esterase